MRIISGKFKGRRFELPSDKWKTRPTTDMAKESLFNILINQYDLSNIKVLDLFAGTGNIGYEFISRGVAEVTFVDKFAGCTRFIQNMCKTLAVDQQAQIIKDDVFRFLKTSTQTYDIIFADPPYQLKTIPQIAELVLEKKLLNPNGCLIIEHDQGQNFKNHPNFLEFRQYGQSYFSFFE